MLSSAGPKVRALCTFLLIALLPVASAAADLTALRKAGDQGDKAAMNQLISLLEHGNKTEKNEAVRWLAELARAGDLDAQLDVAGLYAQGAAELDLEANPYKAEEYYYLALKQTDEALPQVIAFFNEHKLGKPQYHKFALERLLALADQGNAEAQVLAAETLFVGVITEKDDAGAMAWLRKAAAQGNEYARISLALCLINGRGVPPDAAAGIRQLTELADTGSIDAQLYAGVHYYQGIGGKKDFALAAKYLKLATDQGSADAAFAYAKLLDAGEGVPKDRAAALAIWTQLADRSADAAYFAGSAYGDGVTGSPDYLKAAEYFRRAAKLGHPQAAEKLAAAERMAPATYELADNVFLSAEDAIKDGTGRYVQIYSYRGTSGETIKAIVRGRGIGTFNTSRTDVSHLRLLADDGSGKFKPVAGLEHSIRLAKDARIQFMVSTDEPNRDGDAAIQLTVTRLATLGEPSSVTRHGGSDHQLNPGYFITTKIVPVEKRRPVKVRVVSSAFAPALSAGDGDKSGNEFIAALADTNADRGAEAELQYTLAQGESFTVKVSPVNQGAGGSYRMYVDQTLSWQKPLW